VSRRPLHRSCPSAFSDTWVPLSLEAFLTSSTPADSPLESPICCAGDPFAATHGPHRSISLSGPFARPPPATPKVLTLPFPSVAGRAVNEPSNSVYGHEQPTGGGGFLMLRPPSRSAPICHSKIAVLDTRLLWLLIGSAREFLIQ
jgi:hypothetical protein